MRIIGKSIDKREYLLYNILILNIKYGKERFMKIRKAVIPAAGYGTRFLPITKGVPKEMLPIVDKPAIQYIVEEAIDSGITDILIIINRGKELVENHFDRAIEI